MTVTNLADTETMTVGRPNTGTDQQFGTFMSENLPNTPLIFCQLGAPSWVHEESKRNGYLAEEFQKQCHLLCSVPYMSFDEILDLPADVCLFFKNYNYLFTDR